MALTDIRMQAPTPTPTSPQARPTPSSPQSAPRAVTSSAPGASLTALEVTPTSQNRCFFFKKELDPVEVAKIVVGVVIAIYFQQILQRRFSYESKLRDVLLGHVERTEKKLAAIERTWSHLAPGDTLSPGQQLKNVPLFRALSISLGRTEKTLKAAGFSTACAGIEDFVIRLRIYKQILTGGRPMDAAALGKCQSLHENLYGALSLMSIRILEQGKAKKKGRLARGWIRFRRVLRNLKR